MLKKIKPLYFFVAFAIGLIFVYFSTPEPTVILKFPSPYNSGKVQYHDKDSDACYHYEAEKQDSCPLDKTLIREQPLGK